MKNNRGFTLIELLAVVAIIGLLSGIVLINFRAGQDQFALQRSTHILAQDIRRVQELAMRAENFRGTSSRGGFGIHLTSATSSYILFADCDGDGAFDVGSVTPPATCLASTTTNPFPEQLELRTLERGVRIASILPSSPSTIVFIPPDPATRINDGAATVATITLGIAIDGVLTTTTVSVNNAGLIEIR